MKRTTLVLVSVVMASALGLAACEKKGPVEKAGQSVDHAVDTIKNGGKEPAKDKLEDARDDAANAVDKAKDAATGK